MAAAAPPASPLPTTMTLYLRLFAGLMRRESILCLVHFWSSGPDGMLASGMSELDLLMVRDYLIQPSIAAIGMEMLPKKMSAA